MVLGDRRQRRAPQDRGQDEKTGSDASVRAKSVAPSCPRNRGYAKARFLGSSGSKTSEWRSSRARKRRDGCAVNRAGAIGDAMLGPQRDLAQDLARSCKAARQQVLGGDRAAEDGAVAAGGPATRRPAARTLRQPVDRDTALVEVHDGRNGPVQSAVGMAVDLVVDEPEPVPAAGAIRPVQGRPIQGRAGRAVGEVRQHQRVFGRKAAATKRSRSRLQARFADRATPSVAHRPVTTSSKGW